MQQSTVKCERLGSIALVTLDRPNAINAIDLPILKTLRTALTAWRTEPDIRAVVLRGNGRGFCAGGDVKAVAANRGNAAFMDEVYRVEYEVDHLIHSFDRPVIALMHGITMGGGCGLTLHASHPVAADDLVLAMPETGIGLFPDVGGSWFLSRCPDNVGLYMGLTGAHIGAHEAIDFGLARAMVRRDRHDALVDRLAAGVAVDEAVGDLKEDPEETAHIANRNLIATHFSSTSAMQLVRALEREPLDWASETARLLRQRCPFSLEVTIRSYREAYGKILADVLATDFRIAQRLMLRDDYFEGVHRRLIDRSREPSWSPAALEGVDESAVAACFAPLGEQELWNAFSNTKARQ
jgi:enoyl-CoA hydratase/carnithine racemase